MRLLVELRNEDAIIALFVLRDDGARCLVVSTSGRGLIVKAEDLLAEKRTGKQVLNLRAGEETAICVPAEGDHVAVVGAESQAVDLPA